MKTITLLLMTLMSLSLHGQADTTIYCEIEMTPKPLGKANEFVITIDSGQIVTRIKPCEFTKTVDVLNYMESIGWELIHVFTVTSAESVSKGTGSRHFLLRKKKKVFAD